MIAANPIDQAHFEACGFLIKRWAFPAHPWVVQSAREAVLNAESGAHPSGEVYDIPLPAHLYMIHDLDRHTAMGAEAAAWMRDEMLHIVSRTFPALTTSWLHRLHVTTRYPHEGKPHRDLPVGTDNGTLFVMAVLDGIDNLDIAPGTYLKDSANPTGFSANLCPGDVLMMHPATLHRGHCESRRITWYAQFGAQAPAEPSPVGVLPWRVQ